MEDFNARQNANANDLRRMRQSHGIVSPGYYDPQTNAAQQAMQQAQQRYQQAMGQYQQGPAQPPQQPHPQQAHQPHQPQPQQHPTAQAQPHQQPQQQMYPQYMHPGANGYMPNPYENYPGMMMMTGGTPMTPTTDGSGMGMMPGMGMGPPPPKHKKHRKDKKHKKDKKKKKKKKHQEPHLPLAPHPHHPDEAPVHPQGGQLVEHDNSSSSGSDVSGIDDIVFQELARQHLQPPGAREEEFPTEKFQRKVEKLIEVPVERMVKVPMIVQEEVTTVEKRKVPRKKIIEEPSWKLVKEPYTKVVPKEKTRLKEVWVKQLIPETYTVQEVKHCTRDVKVPTTRVREVDVVEEVEVPVRKVIDVQSFRIDKVVDKKVVKVQGIQEFDLIPREGAFQVDKAKSVHRYPAVERIVGREAYRAEGQDLNWIQTDEDPRNNHEVKRSHEPFWPNQMSVPPTYRESPSRAHPGRSHAATPASGDSSPRQKHSYW